MGALQNLRYAVILLAASSMASACTETIEKPDLDNPAPPHEAVLDMPKSRAVEVEEFKTLLWLNAKIDKSLDCRDPKAALIGVNKTDPNFNDLERAYAFCYESGLYYHAYRLPFLNVPQKNSTKMRRELFFEQLAKYQVKYPDVEAEQKDLGFPEPAEIPWEGEAPLPGNIP